MENKQSLDIIIEKFHEYAEQLPYEKKLLFYAFENFVINVATKSVQWSYGMFLGKWKRLSNFIIHVLWVLLWELKFLLKKNKPHGILFQSIPDSKSSNGILNLLSNKYFVYNVGAIENIKIFFNPKIYCIVNTLIEKDDDKIIYDVIENIQIFFKQCNLKVSNQDLIELKLLEKRFFIMNKIVSKIKSNIVLYISDSSLTPQTYFLQYLVQKYGITKSILLDHGIIFYSDLYNMVWADYYLSCGEYCYKKARNIKNKEIIGIIDKNYINFRLNNTQKKIILYILSPYYYSAARVEGRNLEYVNKYLQRLVEVLKDVYPDHKFYLRAHPVDDISSLKKIFNEFTFYQKDLDKILDQVDFCFVEDTSLALDLLKYDIPLIYVPDEFNEEHIHFKKFDFDISLHYNEISYENLQRLLEINKTKSANKKNIYEYYFRPFDEDKFWKIIDEAIQSNRNNRNI